MYESLFIKLLFITGIIALFAIQVMIFIFLLRKIISPAVTESKIIMQQNKIKEFGEIISHLEDKRRVELRRVDNIENYLLGNDIAQGENFDRYKKRKDIIYFAKNNL